MCGRDSCDCKKYRQRKDWVIMDPGCCPSCTELIYNNELYGMNSIDELYAAKNEFYFGITCWYHCVLMEEIFSLNLCNDCALGKRHCSECTDILNK